MAGILPPVTGADIGATGDEWTDAYIAGQIIDADENAVSVADIAGHIDAISGAHPATAISVDASGFNGNLATTDDTVQEVAQKLDDIKLDTILAPTDTTTNNATVSAHGLLPKLGGGTTNYFRADGSWATPPGTYSLPTASASTLGGVKVDGTTITISDGVISSHALSGTITISVGDWSGNACTKSLSGVTASNHIVVGPSPSSADAYGAARIVATAQGDGTVSFSCTAVPTGSVTVNILIFG